MALTSFYSGGTGDPVEGARALAFQTAQGIPATSFTDVLGYGSQVAPQFNRIPSQKINASVMQQPGLIGKMGMAVQPYDFGDFDLGSVNHYRVMANVLRGVATSNPSGAHYRHRISPDQTSSTAPQYMSMLVDDTDGYPRRHHDVVFSGFTIGAAANSNVKLVAPFMAGKVDYWGIVSQETGTGATVPLVRGFCPTEQLAADATDYDIWIKCTTGPSGGSAGFKFKRGSATTYDGPEYTISDVTWTGEPLGFSYDANDSIIGNEAEKFEVYFPDITTVALNDEFKVLKRRAVWTPSYATQRLISEVETRALYAGNTLIPLEGGWSITVTRPGVTRREAPGGRQPYGVTVKGPLQVTVQLERDFVDQELQKLNMSQSAASMVFRMRLDTLIGATTTRYGCYFALPHLEALQQPTFSVFPGGTNRTEAYTYTAYQTTSGLSYDSLTFTSPITVVADNASSSIIT